ncbi:MAG: hypothetical protein IKM51_03600, partial [Oscillospiraceae bacterium]|nr:hypothetical protein [Oscillospiraceae bacterium]
DEFLENSANGVPDSIRVVYCILDFSRVYDLEFDGEKTIRRSYIVDSENELEYESTSSTRKLREDEYDENGVPIDTLHNCYNNDPQAAIDDGCIVLDTQYGLSLYSFTEIMHGEEIWNEFYAKVQADTPARTRICIYEGIWDETIGRFGDFSETEKELLVYQLEYDGRRFYLMSYNKDTGEEICTRYNALVKDTATRKNPVVTYTVYALLMSDEYTWKEVDGHNERVTLSSFFSYETITYPEQIVFMK